MRFDIVCCTGAPAAQHPFLGHTYCVRDSNWGIARGVLAAQSIVDVLDLVRGQDVEEDIKYPWYLIGATAAGTTRPRQDPKQPLPVCQLIFVNRDDDIRAWVLAHNGYDLLDLMVLESCREDGVDPNETPEPPNRRQLFFDSEVWDDLSGGEYVMREMQEEEEWIVNNEWVKGEPEGATRVPSAAGVIIVDYGNVM